ncbi:MAG: universal stress protein [Saprospiraceae bacterium]|nr:universal stress protein [Saprospiraceae bacterium]
MKEDDTKTLGSPSYANVLVGMELAEPDERMMTLLKKLAPVCEMKNVDFLHVLPKTERVDPFAVVYEGAPLQVDREKLEQIAAAIKSRVEKLIAPDMFESMDYFIGHGSILSELVVFSIEKQADLMVVGKNKGNLHAIKSKNLLRQSSADLLVLPQNGSGTFKKICAPIDFSKNSISALKSAVVLAKALDAELYVINIYQRPNLMASRLEMSIERFEKNIEANHKEGFQRFVDKHFPDEKDFLQPILVQSDYPRVSGEILQQAKGLDADLFVIGAKGHSKLARLLLGSTTERLLDLNEDIPTLVVK